MYCRVRPPKADIPIPGQTRTFSLKSDQARLRTGFFALGSDREFGGFLELFHDEAGRDIRHLDPFDEPPVKVIVARDIRDAGADEVVEIPCHPVRAKDFRHLAHRPGKFRQPVGVMAGGPYLDEDRKAEAQFGRIQKRHAFADNAVGFKRFDPSPAGVARKADMIAQLFQTEIGVALQFGENAMI